VNRNRIQITISAIALLGANSVNAAIYSNTTDPDDPMSYTLTLDTGSTLWQNEVSNVYSTSTSHYSEWEEYRYNYNQTPVISVAPRVGVEGELEHYREKVTEYHWGGSDDISGRINYSAELSSDLTNPEPDPLNPVAPQSTPSSYTLQGTFTQNSALSGYYDQLNFNMGLNTVFEPGYTGSAEGTLSFFISNTPGDWTFAFHKTFDTRYDNIGLVNSLNLDLNDPVYFMAQYDIFGTETDLFDISRISLGVSASQYSNGTGIWNEESEIEMYGISVIPALEPVPVPAAAWLFGSGLIGLVGVARRKKSSK